MSLSSDFILSYSGLAGIAISRGVMEGEEEQEERKYSGIGSHFVVSHVPPFTGVDRSFGIGGAVDGR
jgi:hypothetical protein